MRRPYSWSFLSGVRKHTGDNLVIRVGDKTSPAKLALGAVGLRREDVAHLRMAPLELAGTSLMKALGCAAVCLQLWHCVPDENCVLDNLLSIYDVFCSSSIYLPSYLADPPPPRHK